MTAETRRPRPGRGRSASRPEGVYDPEPAVRVLAHGTEIDFVGDDGRHGSFSFSDLPLPELHLELSAGLAERVGPQGGRRTLASAESTWGTLRRFVMFLDTLPDPPHDVRHLMPTHIDRFYRHRLSGMKERYAIRDRHEVLLILNEMPSLDQLHPELLGLLRRRGNSKGMARKPGEAQAGYSARERRMIFAAAREDVAVIRRRIRDGHELVRSFTADRSAVSPDQFATAEILAEAASTGRFPKLTDSIRVKTGSLRSLAAQLFLVNSDLAPLMVYAICATGRNVETLKELPAEHTILDDRAVAMKVTKRRRGKARMFETVHWETGTHASDELKTPGGLYLLLHELTSTGRQFSRSETVWSVWLNGGRPKSAAVARHVDPFAEKLRRDLCLRQWAASKGLTGDDGGPLVLTTSRLKKTEDVRRTRSVGGHLPSAVLTNGIETLFRDYLAGDPSVHDWADDVLDAALHEAETAARDFAPHVLTAAAEEAAGEDPVETARELHTTDLKVTQALHGELDTAVASCLDIEHHPVTGKYCTASFSTCLMCPNALVLERHLPALHALLDELQGALDYADAETWCRRHGTLWLVLTRHILPKFTDAQRHDAASASASVLAALDGLREVR